MATPVGQDYLAMVIQQANQAGEQMSVPAPSIPQIAGGQGMSMPAPPTQGQPSGGGMMNQFQSLPAKMALARANSLNPRSFMGAAEQVRAPRRAMELEKQYQAEQFQQHVNTTKTAVKLFTPIMGEEQAQRFGDMVLKNPKMLEQAMDKFFTATSPTTLQKQVEYVNALEKGSPERTLAEKILFKNSGTRLSMDADGNLLFATDGAPLPSKTTNVTEVEKGLMAAEDAVEVLGYLKEDFNADFLGLQGAVKGAVGSFADWARLPWFNDLKEFGAQREDFVAENRRFVDEYRRQVTGAQASQAELARIEQRLMNAATQGQQAWMTMFNTIIKEQNRKANRQRRKLKMDMLPLDDYLVFSREEMGLKEKEGDKKQEGLIGWDD